MAYVLGYFAADGNMIRNKRGAHFIEFTSTDRELIENVRGFLNSNHKIGSSKRSPRHKRIYRIQIGSKTMFDDLAGLGFTPNKSNMMLLPPVPKKYFADFLRGYFDGDGCVFYGRYKPRARKMSRTVFQVNFVSGSNNFLFMLRERLQQEAGLDGGSLYFTNSYRLLYSKADAIKLLFFMYGKIKKTESALYLKRKFNYFQKALRTIDYQYQKGVGR